MDALQQSVQSNTLLLLLAGAIMVATLWVSRKARTVTRTEVSLGRQYEGAERFGASTLSRVIVGMVYSAFGIIRKIIPIKAKITIAGRLNPAEYQQPATTAGKPPAFDLLRASVNLIVASAIISFATSLKLPLSTTYVTFTAAMGTSFADQAWGRESAVYRITGVLTVIGGWFFTAFAAFTTSLIFAFLISALNLTAIIGLLILATVIVIHTFRYHRKKEQETDEIMPFDPESVGTTDVAVKNTFEQTGQFLKVLSKNIDYNFEATISEDRERLKESRTKADQIEKWANTTIANIFNTLSLLKTNDPEDARRYSSTIRSLQAISESHREIVQRTTEHFENYHTGFLGGQKDELRHLKTLLNRLLWNTSIMLFRRKKVDYNYIESQCNKINELVTEYQKNQIKRIQTAESKTRLSVLFYALLGSSIEISEHTKALLDIFKDFFDKPKGG